MRLIRNEAGRSPVSDAVRELVSRRVASRSGGRRHRESAGLGPRVMSLDERDKAVATLALLVALAPSPLDSSLGEAFRAERPTDRGLVGTAGWATFTAARRVGGWLTQPAG